MPVRFGRSPLSSRPISLCLLREAKSGKPRCVDSKTRMSAGRSEGPQVAASRVLRFAGFRVEVPARRDRNGAKEPSNIAILDFVRPDMDRPPWKGLHFFSG